MKVRSKLGAALAVSMAITGAGCSQDIRGGEAVKSEVYVLVDLSLTWFNAENAERNRRLLTAIGQGASLVAPEVDQPYLVQYRAIGDASYLREPLCSAVFMPGFRRDKIDPERVSRLPALKTYLTRTCVNAVMDNPPEALTQISAAIASVALEPKPSKASRRHLVVVSDFLEETASSAPIPDGSLEGVEVLLLYRPLAEDQIAPGETAQRVEAWRSLLEAKGAHVQVSPDTSMRPSQIVSFLKP